MRRCYVHDTSTSGEARSRVATVSTIEHVPARGLLLGHAEPTRPGRSFRAGRSCRRGLDGRPRAARSDPGPAAIRTRSRWSRGRSRARRDRPCTRRAAPHVTGPGPGHARRPVHHQRRRRLDRLHAPDRPDAALARPDRPVQRGRPIFDDAEIKALVDYAASFGQGPAIPERPGLERVRSRRRDGPPTPRLARRAMERAPAATRSVAARSLRRCSTPPPTQVGEAIRTGPGAMPAFDEHQIPDDQFENIAAYLAFLRDEAAPGGPAGRWYGARRRGIRGLDRVRGRPSPRRSLDRTARAPVSQGRSRTEWLVVGLFGITCLTGLAAARRVHPRWPDADRRRPARRHARLARDRHRAVGTGPHDHERRDRDAPLTRRLRRLRPSSTRRSMRRPGSPVASCWSGCCWPRSARLGAALAIPALSLGPAPGKELFSTAWGAGKRLVGLDGQPVLANDLPIDAIVTVFPEDAVGSADSQTLLIHVPPEALHLPPEHAGWAPEGFVAFSKICTHAGCPVGLYRATERMLICPCHQSTFDVPAGAIADLRTGRPAASPAPDPAPARRDVRGDRRLLAIPSARASGTSRHDAPDACADDSADRSHLPPSRPSRRRPAGGRPSSTASSRGSTSGPGSRP